MLKENLKNILSELSKGNNLGESITLVGATKTVSADAINVAIENGLTVVAENRVQEFREKSELLDKRAAQHFIGHLQTNKVKYLVGKVALIHSVDSLRLAEEISAQATKKGVVQDILCEVNVGGELSKSGFNPDNVSEALKMLSALPNVRLKGLMAMLPISDDENFLAPLFIKMRELYDGFKNNGYPFEYLSMGMSGDYRTAIKYGSNMVRIGSGIFGTRVYPAVTK